MATSRFPTLILLSLLSLSIISCGDSSESYAPPAPVSDNPGEIDDGIELKNPEEPIVEIQRCHFDDPSLISIEYQMSEGNQELHKISLACLMDDKIGLFDLYAKTLTLSFDPIELEGSQKHSQKIRIKVELEGCDDELMNGSHSLGEISASETFNYIFEENHEGHSYFGCQLSKLVLKDKTPKGSSLEAFDINSMKFE